MPCHKLRTDWSDCNPDFEAPYYILKHIYCATLLTKNGFMDNRLSLSHLESNEEKKAIVELHVEGIINFVMGR